ncbi:hypothetical protein [Rhodoferax sp.]|uniref:hypothetical protein n=1 Tax=Rhodoferax sp. TaxID=50421 RepID=UPI0025FB6276|nr:hypothetical protein [Rhodoferax sp.]
MRDLKRWHLQPMQFNKYKYLLAVFFSLALHVLVLALASKQQLGLIDKPVNTKVEATVIFLAFGWPAQ